MPALEITIDNNPATTAESIYGIIKVLAKYGELKAENVEALAELLTELSNRMKEGEFSGE